MAESKVEQIVDAIHDALQAATMTHYTPSTVPGASSIGRAVVRFPELTLACFDDTLGSASTPAVVYVLAPGEEVKEAFTYRHTLSELRIDLALLRQYDLQAEHPFTPPDPDRWKVQNRLAQDAEAALTADRTLGGKALDLEVEMIDRTAENTVDDFMPWAVVFLRLAVLSEHPDGTP